MLDEPARACSVKPQRPGHGRRRWLHVAATTVAVLAFAASTALAARLALTLGSASNATLGEHVVISAQGRTLYALSPETSRHLLCRTSECLRVWPPVTVASSRTKLNNGAGVQGRLGVVRRSNGTLQVTLRGRPLYRYSQDRVRGDSRGEGIESFGGKWHAATAAPSETAKPMTPSAPAQPTTPSYPQSPPMTPSPTPPSMAPSTPSTTPSIPAPPPPPPYRYPTY